MNIKSIKWDSRRISKPGVYHSIPLASYHQWDICDHWSISSSGLRKIYGEETSPRHFYSEWDRNPQRVEKPTPRHFVVGRALHHLTLGEPFFAKLFCLQPDEIADPKTGQIHAWNGNRQICRDWTAARLKEGRQPLTPKEVHAIKNMCVSLGQHPLVQHGALNGAIERSIFWKDRETGIWLKARPDSIPTDSADFADLKTTRSVAWGPLTESIGKFGYYRQIALIRDACRLVIGMDMRSFTLIFIEKQPPWAVRDVRVSERDIEMGAKENRIALRIFAKCIKENRWPGPGEGNEGNELIKLSDRKHERFAERIRAEGHDL
jgi:hypothetical protein